MHTRLLYFIWHRSYNKQTFWCRFMESLFRWPVRSEVRGSSDVKVLPVPPGPQRSLSWRARRPGTEAPGTRPGTHGWAWPHHSHHRRPAGLLCSPRIHRFVRTSQHWVASRRRCARRRRFVRSTAGTRRSCFLWCSCCSRCLYDRCSCRLCPHGSPHHWCLPQNSGDPGRGCRTPELDASSRISLVRLDTDAAKVWCLSPFCFPQSDAGICELCLRQNSSGRHLVEMHDSTC